MRNKSIFVLLTFFLSFSIFAQGSGFTKFQNEKQERERLNRERQEFEDEVEAQFNQSSDLIRQFFDEGELSKFHENFRKMFRNFENMQDFDDSIFTPPGAQKLFQHTYGGANMIEKSWELGPKEDEMTLVLKIANANNQPLNVAVENGTLKVNGTIKKERKNKAGHIISSSTSSINIQETLGRTDIDPNPINMTQDKNGYLNIIFKKKSAAMPQKGPKRRPIPHNDEATSI